MTVKETLTGASPTCSWKSLPWKTISKQVNRLQMRIAKATREGKSSKVKALQRLLTHSFYGKCFAVKRVVTNKGSKTSGCDGALWQTPAQKMNAVHSLKRRGYKPQALKRIYIPKNHNKGLRALSIPCLKDRAMQTLWLLALEPIVEEMADPNSYGFRQKRCTMDAIEQCHNIFARKRSAQYVLEGDIRACFDTLGKSWLLKNTPMDKVILRKFLEAGYVDKNTWYPTLQGAAQGSPLSPSLAVMALSGLEKKLQALFKKNSKIHVVAYADDFVVSGASKELLEVIVKPIIANFLKERGLELSEEKTKITHISEGFDFLGFHVRKYSNGKLLIKPTKANIKKFLENLRKIIKVNVAAETENLICLLNPKIRGWANYYRHAVSSRIFTRVDHEIYLALERWMKKRHPNKGQYWMNHKYFRQDRLRRWQFFANVNDKGKTRILRLVKASDVSIRRFLKIKGEAHPFHPKYGAYFAQRTQMKEKLNQITDRNLFKQRTGRLNGCLLKA